MNEKAKRIFIADDDEDILDILGMMLRLQKYEVVSSTNPEEIFNLTTEIPDIILLDIWMSGMDGREICKRLKADERTSHVPVLFISANSNISDIARECNANGYIAKPFEMSELVSYIRKVLENSSQASEK